jgi:hypothetical protein
MSIDSEPTMPGQVWADRPARVNPWGPSPLPQPGPVMPPRPGIPATSWGGSLDAGPTGDGAVMAPTDAGAQMQRSSRPYPARGRGGRGCAGRSAGAGRHTAVRRF